MGTGPSLAASTEPGWEEGSPQPAPLQTSPGLTLTAQQRPIQPGLRAHRSQKMGNLRGGPAQKDANDKGSTADAHNGVGTNSIHGLHVFLCLPQTAPHSLHTIFSVNHSRFHVQEKRERGIWTDFRLRFSALGLKWASSVSLQNCDMCLQSFVTAAPSCPLSQRRLYFHAEWEGLH